MFQNGEMGITVFFRPIPVNHYTTGSIQRKKQIHRLAKAGERRDGSDYCRRWRPTDLNIDSLDRLTRAYTAGKEQERPLLKSNIGNIGQRPPRNRRRLQNKFVILITTGMIYPSSRDSMFRRIMAHVLIWTPHSSRPRSLMSWQKKLA